MATSVLLFWGWVHCACAQDPNGFAEIAGKRSAAAEGKRAVVGDDKGWLFLRKELDHIAEGAFWEKPIEKNQDSAKEITEYAKALKEMGVELLLVPVPAKASIYPEKLVKGTKAADVVALAPFYKKLEAGGVKVLDLEPEFRKMAATTPLYCATDTHWSPAACGVVADLILKTISKRPDGSAVELAIGGETKLAITGDLADEPHTKGVGKETLMIQPAGKDGGKTPLAPDPASPVLLIGDSHTLVFSEGASSGMHCKGAGLLDHLQAKLGYGVTLVASKASGGDGARLTLARSAAKDPSVWAGKKVVVWCFSVREFTQARRWRTIPPKP